MQRLVARIEVDPCRLVATGGLRLAHQLLGGGKRVGSGGRPVGFDKTICKRRNQVERTINALKNLRAVATRFDKRAYVFHGTVTLASIPLWLRP
jgi:transposase